MPERKFKIVEMEIPIAFGPLASLSLEILQQFIESGSRCSRVDIDGNKSSIYGSLARMIRAKDFPVKIHMKKSQIYLESTSER